MVKYKNKLVQSPLDIIIFLPITSKAQLKTGEFVFCVGVRVNRFFSRPFGFCWKEKEKTRRMLLSRPRGGEKWGRRGEEGCVVCQNGWPSWIGEEGERDGADPKSFLR